MADDKIKKDSNYPKRVFEVIQEETHYKEESEYFYYTDPSFFH